MKSISLATALLCISSSGLAQDYYTPVKKELEPLARFPLKDFALSNEKLSYQLPLDLTGNAVAIEMQRVASEVPGMRLYQGERANASCMGTDTLPACVIQHWNLPRDPAKVSQFLDAKYLDIKLRDDAKQISELFNNGNEPIGFISRRALQSEVKLPTSWMTSFTGQSAGKPFIISDVQMRWDGDRGTFILPQGVEGQIERLFIDGGHVSAYWRTPQDHGWIDLQLASDRQSFQGSWGRDVGQAAEGLWRGKAL